LSAASVWEAEIKYAIGKLPLPARPAIYLPRERRAHQISSMDIDEGAIEQLSRLPQLHRDPFDRMIVAQAFRHKLTLVTVDAAVRAYAPPLMPV